MNKTSKYLFERAKEELSKVDVTEVTKHYLSDEKLLNFSQALEYLKKGFKITRKEWKECKKYIFLFKQGDYQSIMCGFNDESLITNWFPDYCDILAEDWIICEQNEGKK